MAKINNLAPPLDPPMALHNCEADDCLCFCYIDSTIPLLSKSKISSFLPSSVAAHAGLHQTWSETPLWLIYDQINVLAKQMEILILYLS